MGLRKYATGQLLPVEAADTTEPTDRVKTDLPRAVEGCRCETMCRCEQRQANAPTST